MVPTREEAIALVRDGLACNPGPWGRHCLTAAHCAEKIASACGDMDSEKAYILGLLHDIGRKFGTRHLGHVSDGYTYMKSLGYDEVAKICLTHSFNNHTVDEYIGKFDVSQEELTLIKTKLVETVYDEYDLLIQLCDSLAGADGVLDIEERMNDVKRRYGSYPQDKWDSNIELMHYFEKRMNQNIYLVCEKDTFVPEELA
ncbi:MAG: HD domain-containing protein [Lachnospiraceae bacterium]|nr:HD domain-containing protein [Lachnospiraceae bacterium]